MHCSFGSKGRENGITQALSALRSSHADEHVDLPARGVDRDGLEAVARWTGAARWPLGALRPDRTRLALDALLALGAGDRLARWSWRPDWPDSPRGSGSPRLSDRTSRSRDRLALWACWASRPGNHGVSPRRASRPARPSRANDASPVFAVTPRLARRAYGATRADGPGNPVTTVLAWQTPGAGSPVLTVTPILAVTPRGARWTLFTRWTLRPRRSHHT